MGYGIHPRLTGATIHGPQDKRAGHAAHAYDSGAAHAVTRWNRDELKVMQGHRD